jgi:hypothetical protein
MLGWLGENGEPEQVLKLLLQFVCDFDGAFRKVNSMLTV